MSGFQGPLPGGPPPQAGAPPSLGAPQQQGQPQIPPQVLQMILQHLQQGGGQGGPPMPAGAQPQQGPPGGGSPLIQAAPPGAPPPTGPMPGQGAPMSAPPGQHPMTPAQMAMQGRFGDKIVGHLTPGEIQVPPQVQTQKLLKDLQQAFAHYGVSPAQFTAGSPQSSTNPATGAPEYSLFGALLPILGAGIGTAIAPGIGTAIGGGLGGGAGAALDHQTPVGVGLSALGGAAGGYLGAGGASAAAAGTASGVSPAVDSALSNAAASGGGSFPAAAASSPFGSVGSYFKPGFSAGIGSAVGGALAPQPTTGSQLPPGFSTPLAPLNGQYNQLLGNRNANTPSFQGYNPYAAATGQGPVGGYNFYSPQGNGT